MAPISNTFRRSISAFNSAIRSSTLKFSVLAPKTCPWGGMVGANPDPPIVPLPPPTNGVGVGVGVGVGSGVGVGVGVGVGSGVGVGVGVCVGVGGSSAGIS